MILLLFRLLNQTEITFKKIRFEKEEELRRQEDIKEAIYQARAINIFLRS